MNNLLTVEKLSKTFGALRASDGIDFDVVEGETHAVIGPNGAGKTTFIGQLAGNLRPDAGRIAFAGEDITRLPAQRRAQGSCPLLPDHERVPRLHGAAERGARGAGAFGAQLPLLARRAQRCGAFDSSTPGS